MSKQRQKVLTLSGLGIGAVLFLVINLLSFAGLSTLRIDLTENKRYTLSEGTKHILAQIDEPITLQFYYSKQLSPGLVQIDNYSKAVETLLQLFVRASNGKLILQAIDPEPFSPDEDLAMSYGLQGIPLNNQGQLFYFGLVGTNTFGDERTVRFFQPERESFLEYDLSQLIYQLSHPTQATVGVLSSRPIQGGLGAGFFGGSNTQPWGIWEMMDPLFNLQQLDTSLTTIPNDIDVLLLVSPKNLSAQTTYAIDQFVLNGGHLLAFIDTYTQETGPTSENDITYLNLLLNRWGLQLDGEHVVADIGASKQVYHIENGRRVLIDYPLWMDIAKDHLNDDDPVTGQLELLTVASPSLLEPLPSTDVVVTPLLTTTNQAMPVNVNSIAEINEDPQAFVRDYQSTNTAYLLAARITGHLQSAFSSGPPTAIDTEADPQAAMDETPVNEPHLNESIREANIIIMADSDMIEDRFWLQRQNLFGQSMAIPFASNGNFIVNALDNLSGNNDLISIRGKGDFRHPFTRIREIQQNAEIRYRETEQTLLSQLDETEQQLNALNDQQVVGDQIVLSEAQQQALEEFRTQQITIRTQLRDVQHALQNDIDELMRRIKIIDIGLVPLLVGISGLSFSVYRTRKRRKTLKRSRN